MVKFTFSRQVRTDRGENGEHITPEEAARREAEEEERRFRESERQEQEYAARRSQYQSETVDDESDQKVTITMNTLTTCLYIVMDFQNKDDMHDASNNNTNDVGKKSWGQGQQSRGSRWGDDPQVRLVAMEAGIDELENDLQITREELQRMSILYGEKDSEISVLNEKIEIMANQVLYYFVLIVIHLLCYNVLLIISFSLSKNKS